jgi:hypothetical protein
MSDKIGPAISELVTLVVNLPVFSIPWLFSIGAVGTANGPPKLLCPDANMLGPVRGC